MAEWHYLKDEQQIGPVSEAELKTLAGAGKLTPDDSVWKDGMIEWMPASRLPGLFPAGGATGAAAVEVADDEEIETLRPTAPIDYFSPTSDLNTQAAAVLRGFPQCAGQRGRWPVSEDDLALLAATARRRAPIRRAAALYRVLFYCGLVCSIAGAVLYLLLAARFDRSGRRQLPVEAALGILLPTAVVAGLGVLCLFASRATYKCQVWGPIAMIVHFAGWLLCLSWGLYHALEIFAYDPSLFVVVVVALIPAAISLGVSVQALTSIPKFLSKPLWCVHLLINSKL